VTPPDLKPWAKVSLMDAGHFDALTAYAAINTIRLDDLRPRRMWTDKHTPNGVFDPSWTFQSSPAGPLFMLRHQFGKE
jgi:hypothetical protein